MGKSDKKEKKKKEAKENGEEGAKGGREIVKGKVSVIAVPLAEEELQGKVLKLVGKATKRKAVRRGVKEVVKTVRQGGKGVCVIAGDISPIDVITHVPVLCEDKGIPYVFVQSKEELGGAGSTKRPTSCVLLMPEPVKKGGGDDAGELEKYKKDYEKISKKVASLQTVLG